MMSNGYHIVFLQHVFVFDFLIKNDLVYCFVHWFCVVFEMVLSVLPSKTYIFFLKHMRFDMLFQFFNVDGSISSISIASHFTGPSTLGDGLRRLMVGQQARQTDASRQALEAGHQPGRHGDPTHQKWLLSH